MTIQQTVLIKNQEIEGTGVKAPLIADLNYVHAETANPGIRYEKGNQTPIYLGRHELRPTVIENARAWKNGPTLDQEGFERLSHRLPRVDFEDDAAVEAFYYPEVEHILKNRLGVRDVFFFDHTIRKDGNIQGRQPVRHVHVDYTDRTGPERFLEVVGEEFAARAKGRHYMQVNTWRSIRGPIRRSPIAFMDASTAKPGDLVHTRLDLQDLNHIGEIFHLRYSEDQRWGYFPDLDQDEVVLIKSYDSINDGRARFTPHSAFDLPDTPADAPARESIEVRAFVVF